MKSDREARLWALRRLNDFAEHLTPHGSEVKQLRAAGVNESRISTLYPFDFQDFASATYLLTGASWRIVDGFEPVSSKQQRVQITSLLLENHACLANPSRFFVSENVQLDRAVKAADEVEQLKSASFLFEVALQTLNLLAINEIKDLSLMNPFTNEVMPLRRLSSWEDALHNFVNVVDGLHQALQVDFEDELHWHRIYE